MIFWFFSSFPSLKASFSVPGSFRLDHLLKDGQVWRENSRPRCPVQPIVDGGIRLSRIKYSMRRSNVLAPNRPLRWGVGSPLAKALMKLNEELLLWRSARGVLAKATIMREPPLGWPANSRPLAHPLQVKDIRSVGGQSLWSRAAFSLRGPRVFYQDG
jgi:hypothetical protein